MSTITFVCPITKKRERAPWPEGEADGVFLPVDEEDGDNPVLPMGWGRLTIEQVVHNPEVDQIRTARRVAVEQMTAAVEAQAKGDSDQAASIRAEIESGEASQQIQAAVEDQFPMPESDRLTLRATYSAISDEAIAEILGALKQVGVEFRVGGGE